MANTTDVAAGAAIPSRDDIDRASSFAREPFLQDGEGPDALAPGTARSQALDAALKEARGRGRGSLDRVAPATTRCCSAWSASCGGTADPA